MGLLGVLLSGAVHGITFVALGAVQVTVEPLRPPQEVEFSVVEEKPLEPEPEPEPVNEPEPEPEPVKVVKAPKPVAKAPEPTKAAEPPPAAEETLADFSGTTLTSEGVGGWASAVGSGAPMNAPIGKANAVVTGRDRAGVQGGVVGGSGGPRVVGEAELSRRPKAPNQDLLDAALQKHYPRGARDQGIEGGASIKIRILANGSVQVLATLSESYPGFAEACKASMRNQSWTPGLDSGGQPVATDIPFKCAFALE